MEFVPLQPHPEENIVWSCKKKLHQVSEAWEGLALPTLLIVTCGSQLYPLDNLQIRWPDHKITLQLHYD